MIKKILQFTTFVAVLCIMIPSAMPQRESTSYKVIRDTVGTGGGNAVSTNYTHQTNVGSIAGTGTSTNYSNVSGAVIQINSISGIVYDFDGITPLTSSSQVMVLVFRGDPCGSHDFVTESMLDGSGNYLLPRLVSGDYFLRLDTMGTNYIAEWYDGMDGAFRCEDALIIKINVSGTFINHDFVVDQGSRIAGSIQDDSPTPLENVQVNVFNTNGSFITQGVTDSTGNYITDSGLAPGIYLANTVNGLGYIDQAFTDMIIVPNVVITVDNIDVDLVLGGTISGTVVDMATTNPLRNIDIAVFNSSGTEVSRTTTDNSGFYLTSGLAAGNYYARTFNSQQYLEKLYNSPNPTGCSGNCNVLDGAEISVTVGSDQADINFALDPGGSISGRVTNVDITDLPIRNITVDIIDLSGATFTTGTTDFNGDYRSSSGLPAGTYFALVPATSNYHAGLYNNFDCSTSCDPVNDGTEISVTAGEEATGIDLKLAPVFQIVEISVCTDHGGTEICLPVTEGNFLSRLCGFCDFKITFNRDVKADSINSISAFSEILDLQGLADFDVNKLIDNITLTGNNELRIDFANIPSETVVNDSPVVKANIDILDLTPNSYQLSFTTNIQDISNTPLGGDRDLNFDLIVGEVNDVSPVDIGDMIAVRAHAGQPLNEETARYDINYDGDINGGDIGAVRKKLGDTVD